MGGSNIQSKHGAIHGPEIQTKFLVQTFATFEGKLGTCTLSHGLEEPETLQGFFLSPRTQ